MLKSQLLFCGWSLSLPGSMQLIWDQEESVGYLSAKFHGNKYWLLLYVDPMLCETQQGFQWQTEGTKNVHNSFIYNVFDLEQVLETINKWMEKKKKQLQCLNTMKHHWAPEWVLIIAMFKTKTHFKNMLSGRGLCKTMHAVYTYPKHYILSDSPNCRKFQNRLQYTLAQKQWFPVHVATVRIRTNQKATFVSASWGLISLQFDNGLALCRYMFCQSSENGRLKI